MFAARSDNMSAVVVAFENCQRGEGVGIGAIRAERERARALAEEEDAAERLAEEV